MLVNQLSIYLQNEVGELDKLAKVIADANINLSSMNIADTTEFGICRIITDDNEKAFDVIRRAEFLVKSSNLVAIEVQNKPGRLSKVLEELAKESISIEYLYSYDQGEGKNLILFKTAQTEKAEKIISELKI